MILTTLILFSVFIKFIEPFPNCPCNNSTCILCTHVLSFIFAAGFNNFNFLPITIVDCFPLFI